MKHLVWILLAAMLVACSDEKQKAAEQMLQKASLQFEQRQYDRALITID